MMIDDDDDETYICIAHRQTSQSLGWPHPVSIPVSIRISNALCIFMLREKGIVFSDCLNAPSVPYSIIATAVSVT